MKKNARRFLAIMAVAVLAASSLACGFRSAIHAQLDAWKLLSLKERFTELYFVDHVHLPRRISKGETVSFSFVIHNLEGEKKEYAYSVYYRSQDGQIIKAIEEDAVTLADGESITIEESYTSTLPETSGGIHVELEGEQLEIHLLLNSDN